MKASLRNICKEAGVTTGALYFFFKDKEDLFAALVEKPLKQLYLTMEEHYAAEMRSETQVVRLEQNDDDLETSREIIRQMYANRDAFLLLLTKSQDPASKIVWTRSWIFRNSSTADYAIW